jgi:hypothetical protein
MAKPALNFVVLTCLLAIPLIAVILVGYAPPALTPNDQFPVVSSAPTPQIDASTWTLTVSGDVDHELTYTYASLTALPNVTEVARLQCVDGPSGVAAWGGVPLNTILQAAGVHADAKSVVFYCADGYSTSLAIPKENTSDVLLAWEMNYVPLPPDHGYPVRVVAPNELGYKWAKWVTGIQVVNYDYQGYWESRGWSNNAEMVPTTDWRLHALLFSIVFLLGGLAAISGVKLSPTLPYFRNLPDFVSRKFHIGISLAFFPSAIGTFIYWSFATFANQGTIFFTLHGIVSLVCMSVITLGAILGFIRIRHNTSSGSFRHGNISLLGFFLLLITILLGFALTAGSDVISQLAFT